MTKFNGLIFDFNGVLFWDNRLHEEAWRALSEQVRGWPFDSDEMAHQVHGRNNRTILHYLLGRPLKPEEYERLSLQKEQIYRRLCLDLGQDFRLSPGAEALLGFLLKNHVPYTIATASGKGNVDFFIEHLALARWFDLQKIVYDDGTMAGKPAPDFYLRAAAVLQLQPRGCIVVEDSLSGAKAARAAGIGRVLGLVGDNDDLLGAEPEAVDGIIENFNAFDRLQFL